MSGVRTYPRGHSYFYTAIVKSKFQQNSIFVYEPIYKYNLGDYYKVVLNYEGQIYKTEETPNG